MKKILTLLALTFSIVIASAQDDVYAIMDHLQTDRISVSFTCTFNADTPFDIKGDLLVQGNSFFLSGMGYEIRSHGGTRWTTSTADKEVYVEKAQGLEELYPYWERISNLKITSVKYLPLSQDMSPFIVDTAKLGAGWVVTDLR